MLKVQNLDVEMFRRSVCISRKLLPLVGVHKANEDTLIFLVIDGDDRVSINYI